MALGFILLIFTFFLSNWKEGSWDVGDRKGKDLELIVPKPLHFLHVMKKISAFYKRPFDYHKNFKKWEGHNLRIKGSSLNWINLVLWNTHEQVLFFSSL